MKIFFSLFFLIALLLAALPFLEPSEETRSVTGLPWQIAVLPDGSTQVFGLHIGNSNLSDAIEIIGNDMELAVIAASDEIGSLEMYYGRYQAGLLSGKLLIQTDTSDERIQRFRDNAVSSVYMASGRAKKFLLNDEDLNEILRERITGVTFIPSVNLDRDVIIARFGEPDETLEYADVTHYLYADKGLHIAFYENAKEILQYVAPAKFSQLRQPLHNTTVTD